jgi:hypothetical protein
MKEQEVFVLADRALNRVGLWDELTPVAEEWRKIGVFPVAVPAADDAPLMQRLLGITGRGPG